MLGASASVGDAFGARTPEGRSLRRWNKAQTDARTCLPAAQRKLPEKVCGAAARREACGDAARLTLPSRATEPGDPRQLEASRRMEGLRAEGECLCAPETRTAFSRRRPSDGRVESSTPRRPTRNSIRR